MGGWVVIASALRKRLPADQEGILERCKSMIELADTWYATDTLAERVAGAALRQEMESALKPMQDWVQSINRWVRRACGVAVHNWAKQAHGRPECREGVQCLLAFLEPLFEEREKDALKGIGWGLKTLGRYYPRQVAGWLQEQMDNNRAPRALMLRKAYTFLPDHSRQETGWLTDGPEN